MHLLPRKKDPRRKAGVLLFLDRGMRFNAFSRRRYQKDDLVP
jgi:hypothetical protein